MAGVSKYTEIKEQLQERILAGDWPVAGPGQLTPDARLPTEDDLATAYQTSKMTVKRALDELVLDGVLVRKSGLGTWVIRKPRGGLKLPSIVSLSEQIRAAGLEPVTEVLEAKRTQLCEEPDWIRDAFEVDVEVAETTDVYVIDRLRKARDGEGNVQCLARQTLYLLAAQFPATLLEEDLTGSIFKLYARYGAREPSEAIETVTFRPATPTEMEVLDLKRAGECECPPHVVGRRRTTLDQHRIPLEVMDSVDQAEWFGTYTYRLTMARRDENAG